MTTAYRYLMVLTACLMCSLLAPARADDWPALRGGGSGAIGPKSLLAGDDFGLKLRWKQPVGSGYSSVVVVEDRVVVMFADGKDDVVAALNADDGKPVWKVSVGPTFKGANGSFDGPLSTPLVTDGNVIALSARGRLVSVDLKSGELKWSRELADEEKAQQPLYGFTTSPVLAGETVVIQLGAKDKSVIGIDPVDGKTLWSAGSDRVSSQTPVVYKAGEREIVLASGGKYLNGIDPKDGSLLFEVEHGGGNGSAVTPVSLGDGSVLLTIDDSFSTAFRIKSDGKTVSAVKAWQNRSIKNTYNIPVVHEDNVFAFSTRFLTCVDPATGKPRWKNRKPGDGFLAVVDGKLIISTKRGSLHIAETSPSRYEEIASLKVFDDLNWSLPAFSNNAIYMRSFGAVARVDVTQGGTKLADSDTADEMPVGTAFAKFLKQVSAAQSAADRLSVVDKFLARQDSFPITEGDVVHFLYRGECTDAAVACDVFGARQERKMVRVAGTDLHYFAMRLPADQRANYVFLVDYKVQPDKLNERRTTSSMYAGEMEFAVRLRNEKPLEMCWFAMPEWKQPAFLSVMDKSLKGKIVSHEIEPADDKGAKRSVDVYLPPSYETSEMRYPVVYVQDGSSARSLGRIEHAADAIFSSGVDQREAILVFLKNSTNPMARQADPSKAIAEQVVPFIDKTYKTIADRSGRSCYGTGFNCATALGLVASRVDLFSAVSVQSPLVFDEGQKQLLDTYAKIDKPLRIYVEWGSFDMHNPHENWDIRTIGKSLADGMAKNKSLTVTSRQVNDSTDWRSWVGGFDKVLAFLTAK